MHNNLKALKNINKNSHTQLYIELNKQISTVHSIEDL